METLKMKICVIGASKTGKTLICKLLADQALSATPIYRSTEEAGLRIQEYQFNSANQRVRVQLWDCSGSQSVRPQWSTLAQGLDGVVLVYDTETPGQEAELERFYKGFAQPYKLTVQQCLCLGVNLTGSYSMRRGLSGQMASLPQATIDIDPHNPEAASATVKSTLDKLFGACLERSHDRQKKEIEEEVLEDDDIEE